MSQLRIRLAQEVLRVGDIAPQDRTDEAERVRSYARSREAVAYEAEGRVRQRMRNA